MNTDSRFFTFIQPALNYIDSGDFFRKPFAILYKVIGVLILLLPFYILIEMVNFSSRSYGPFAPRSSGAGFWLTIILTFLFFIVVCWFSFQLWWDRSKKIERSSEAGDNFVATHIFSHFVQTLGEWYGFMVIVISIFTTVVTLLLMGFGVGSSIPMGRGFMPYPGFSFGEMPFLSLIIGIISGFAIVLISRFLAEQMKAFAEIANNTNGLKKQSSKDLSTDFMAEEITAPADFTPLTDENPTNITDSSSTKGLFD
ncbi:MAG: hypothetical protein GQ574_24295 [Crocinitomix sp.]|nr:hypothetical protein [Crocinitomix sp.]